MLRLKPVVVSSCVLATLAITVACDRKPIGPEAMSSPKAEPLPYRQASASEVFNLRSRCAQLGEKMVDDDIHGPAVSVSATSHYNPRTNRCYVLMNTWNVDDPSKVNHQYLYDGQTKDMLAVSGTADGKQSGNVFGDLHSADPNERNLSPFEQANDYIREQMSDDRAA